MGWACSTYGGEENCELGFHEEDERPRCIWEDNIKMSVKGTGWENVDWINVAQDRDKWRAVMNLRVL